MIKDIKKAFMKRSRFRTFFYNNSKNENNMIYKKTEIYVKISLKILTPKRY